MGFFRRKSVFVEPIVKEEFISLMEMLKDGGLSRAIESSIQKTVDQSQYYQTYDNADTNSNYFGSEFNIRATAGRIKGTYSREPWVFATASLIAKTLISVPYKVINVATGEEASEHPLNKKMQLGSPISDYVTNSWNGYLDLVLGGNYFRVYDETYTQCFHYPVEQVQVQLDSGKKQVSGLILYDSQNIGRTFVPIQQVVHHKYPNPFYPFYGMSIFTAASRPIILDRFKNEFEMAFYLRGATNAGVIETTEDINKSRMERLMRTFEQVYTGKRNWWRTIFLPKGAKWIQSGLTMSEMQHLEGLRENRLTLLAVLGIPPSQLGIVQDVNRATSEEQTKAFWNNTIKPFATFIASGWNNSYLVKVIYAGQVRVEPDFSEIEALQGSLITKGEQAKSIENYFLIDEIRALVFDEDPLPGGKGSVFVAEIRASTQQSGQSLLSAPQVIPNLLESSPMQEDQSTQLSVLKAQVVSSQNRIESRLTDEYLAGYQKYIDALLAATESALISGIDVEKHLKSKTKALAKIYDEAVNKVLNKCLDRGFSLSNSQAKSLSKIQTKKLRFRDVDQQAIDTLKDEQSDGQRTTLKKRSIESFVGFNETRSKEILDLIAGETANGKTLDQIAAIIRELYGERYKNQAFTIARTELLTAISQGLKWNHDILGEVFSEVQKQWFHVGDYDSNPDARDWHHDFELEGPQASNYKWGGVLDYPRDPNAGPGDNVNCRCSMTSVIPDKAESNAEVILNRI